jgi:hypothetical protein
MMNRAVLLWVCLAAGAGTGAGGEEVRRRQLLPAPVAAEGNRIETGVFLGVMSLRVSEEVQAQLALPVGFGLVVEAVLAGSPAEKAGLRRYDVLLAFGDQELVNPEQLLALVRRSRKGDEVVLKVVSQAVAKEVRVVLDEGPVETAVSPVLAEGAAEGNGRAMVPAKALAEQGEEPVVRGRAVRRDESGEYVLNHEEETMTFSASPKEGEGGAWPVGSEAEREAVPERFREKLRGLLEVLEKAPYADSKVSG